MPLLWNVLISVKGSLKRLLGGKAVERANEKAQQLQSSGSEAWEKPSAQTTRNAKPRAQNK